MRGTPTLTPTLTLPLPLTRCDDGASKSLGHTPPPERLVVYVSNFNIEP